MRAVECEVPMCAHMHAESDEELTREVLRHAQEVHPEEPFTEDMARDFVRAGVHDDAEHAPATQ